MQDDRKWCPKCKKKKPTCAFSKNTKRSDGLQSHCKICRNKQAHIKRLKDFNERLERDGEARWGGGVFVKKYKINPEDIMSSQDFKDFLAQNPGFLPWLGRIARNRTKDYDLANDLVQEALQTISFRMKNHDLTEIKCEAKKTIDRSYKRQWRIYQEDKMIAEKIVAKERSKWFFDSRVVP